MKRTILAAMMVFITLALTGCGDGGSSPPPTFFTEISSDPAFDGDIQQDSITGAFTVRQSPLTVRAGLDPLTGDEYRGFLHFSLATVPLDAVIVSATLDIVINSIVILPTANTIPIRIELVSFQPPLADAHFDLLPLANTTFPVFRTDVGNSVRVDVTALMAEAQFRGLDNFQIRILEDFGIVSPGLIEIDDTNAFAPLLEVTYF